ncbi:DUF1642 domain-containing protein [Lactococcus lactis]|uniref:DUF1642 domain-containing protein n=1 Tax=Lactococcus lactis TaxID=1358 RepID=UPI00387823F1
MTKFEEEFEHELDYFIERELSLDEKLSFGARDALVEFFSGWRSPEHIEKETQMKLLKLQQQALPVVPEDVAKLPPFDDMKEYVLDERLLTIREYLNKLDDKSNSDITEAEAWCMIHEDIVYRAMLDGYTVEKPQLFYLKNKLTGDCLAICLARASSGLYVEVTEKWLTRKEQTSYKLYFTQQEIDSMQTGSYEQIEVEK